MKEIEHTYFIVFFL